MNKVKNTVTLLLLTVGLWAVPVVPIALLVGCSGGCASVDPGSETLVVRAEQTYQGTTDVFKAFTTYEYNNRAILQKLSPEIEKAANTIRTDGFNAVESLQKAVVEYKANRTAENRSAIETWLQRVDVLERLVVEYFAKAKLQQ